LFLLAALKECQLARLNVLPLFTLCSARVSELVIVLSDNPCERIGKWETCLILKESRSLESICDKNFHSIRYIESESF
jgi:hypothetical protein